MVIACDFIPPWFGCCLENGAIPGIRKVESEGKMGLTKDCSEVSRG